MVIKKKSTKPATATKAVKSQKATTAKSKSNRGRPRKEFKPKHKRIQEQAQSTTTLVEHKMPSRERILRMPNKDKSIFYLFIFSIVLFLCSLAISFVKKQNVEDLQATQTEENTVVAEAEETPVIEETETQIA